jgi:membrane-associated protease RseP (regulator of RpoE activity)
MLADRCIEFRSSVHSHRNSIEEMNMFVIRNRKQLCWFLLAIATCSFASAFGGEEPAATAPAATESAPPATAPVATESAPARMEALKAMKGTYFLDRNGDAGAHYSLVLAHTFLASNPLGIEINPVDPTLAAQLNIEGGLVVTNAPEGSEGAKAGLHAHDVLLSINGPRAEPVREVQKFREILSNNAGQAIEIAFLRGGKLQLLKLSVPKPQEFNIEAGKADISFTTRQTPEEKFRIGVSLAEADDTLRSHLQLQPGQGLVITEVIGGSAAEKAGVKANDVLLELDGKALTSPEEVTKQVQEIKDKQVELKIIRIGKPLKIQLAPEKNASIKVDSRPAYIVLEHPASQSLKGLLFTQEYGSAGTGFGSAGTEYGTIVVDSSFSNVAAKDFQAQIKALKDQLLQMQKTVTELEASLTAKSQQQAPPPTAEEKK